MLLHIIMCVAFSPSQCGVDVCHRAMSEALFYFLFVGSIDA